MENEMGWVGSMNTVDKKLPAKFRLEDLEYRD
jgi:hypothetical protein